MKQAPSPNHDERPPGTPVDILLLHYTGMQSAAAAIERLRDPVAHVSSHYVVEEDGLVWQLVPEERRAWHAGISYWRGHTGLNDRSVGIEIVNPGHEWGYRPFPALQMAAVCELCLGILRRHPIPARNVIGHSDVAPDRKEDPGELFDWRGLAANGVGLWPARSPQPDALPQAGDEALLATLNSIGYRTDLPTDVLLQAFQRHWRPERVDGVPDAGTRDRLGAMVACLGTGERQMNVALRKAMSREEFLAWEERQELRWECDGFAPVAMTGGTRNHAAIQVNLIAALHTRLRGRPCNVLGSQLKLSVSGSFRYPDAMIVCTAGRGSATVLDDPVVVFEIVSASTVKTDRFTKNAEYRGTASIQRYVILEQDTIAAEVFTRAGEDWAGRVQGAGSILDLPEAGIEVPLDDLYEGVELLAGDGP